MMKNDRMKSRKDQMFPRGTPEFKAWNWGNRPAILRFCYDAGFRVTKVNVNCEVIE